MSPCTAGDLILFARSLSTMPAPTSITSWGPALLIGRPAPIAAASGASTVRTGQSAAARTAATARRRSTPVAATGTASKISCGGDTTAASSKVQRASRAQAWASATMPCWMGYVRARCAPCGSRSGQERARRRAGADGGGTGTVEGRSTITS
jgi:hypothetical protein